MGKCGSKAPAEMVVPQLPAHSSEDDFRRKQSKDSSSSSGSPSSPLYGRSSESRRSRTSLTSRDSSRSFSNLRRESLFLENRGDIFDLFEVSKKKIGEGAYGSVSKAIDKSTRAPRAVKSVSKSLKEAALERTRREIEIMKLLDHPNIVKLYETFEDSRNIYLVMELCHGGELFDRIIGAGFFTEVQAASVMKQIIRGIYYMHSVSVCHRDLKPENFLFQSKDAIETSLLKIIDYGLAKTFTPGDFMKTKAGTPFYVSPQVLQGHYDHMSDMWSVGVIMYVLLCGYPPFNGDTEFEVLKQVKAAKFSFAEADWGSVSSDAKQLIRWLLRKDAHDRCTAEEALNHIWIKREAPNSKEKPLQKNVLDRMRHFRGQNMFKKAALHTIAANLNDEEIMALRETFVALDGNADGHLTMAELSEGIKETMDTVPADLQQLLEEVDGDQRGKLNYSEFLAATLDQRHYLQENICWAAFRIFDRNGDGKITRDELKEVLDDDSVHDAVGQDTISVILLEVDADGDGMIDFDEFMAMMRKDNLGSMGLTSQCMSPRGFPTNPPSRKPLKTFRPCWTKS